MENITLKTILTKEEIETAVATIATEIENDFKDKPNPLIVAIMDASIMFAADLLTLLSNKFKFATITLKSYTDDNQVKTRQIAFCGDRKSVV